MSFSFWDANGDKFVILAPSGPRDFENQIPWWKVINCDGANVSECLKYNLLTLCEFIFGGPTGGPYGGLRSQVSSLESQVSGLGSQV